MKASLEFVEEPFSEELVGSMLQEFREKGYVVLREVFARDSVDRFLNDVLGSLIPGNDGQLTVPPDSRLYVWPTRAPRLRQLLSPALSHAKSMKRSASLYAVNWHVLPEQEHQHANEVWHLDLDPEGMPDGGYHFPREIHVGMYFSDMTPALGPTEVVPGSHRNPQELSPFRPKFRSDQAELFACAKEDVILWDQRLWHRATRRTVPGYRVFAVFGFYTLPADRHKPRKMPAAQHAAWQAATSPAERAFYGGGFDLE